MRKKVIFSIVLCLVCLALATCLVACGDKQQEENNQNGENGGGTSQLKDFDNVTFLDDVVIYDGQEHVLTVNNLPDGAEVAYSSNKATEIGDYRAQAVISKEGYKTKTLTAKLTVMPSAQLIVDSRKVYAEAVDQNYDFFLNLSDTLDVLGYKGTANANYDGKYRYNINTNDLQFKRITSGILLYDSTEYIYTKNDSKIKLVQNDKNEVKKLSVIAKNNDELNLMNLPFASIVDSLKTDNISDIRYSGKSDFRYTATLSLSSENALLKKLYSKLEQMGTRLEMSEVSISNPMAIKFDFNLDSNHRLSDFRFGADVTFPVKNVPVKIAVSYEQKASNANIAIPSVSDFIVEKNDISNVLATINGALSRVKNQNTYSLDVSAINDFDPGWNITATVDKYIARMYKNTTDDGRIDFNHSFVYKAHTDEDGKENFKFTIGNIENGDVYRISRKGSNTQTKIDGVSADGQFDYLTSMIKMSADDIDCIKTVQKDGSTFYYLYQNKNATGKQQSSIVEMINSNPADSVTDVENYFNEENNEVADTEMVVEMKDGQLVSINANTKFRYCPTGGEYTEQNVVLTNEIELLFNAKAEDAQSYIAPAKVETTIGKLGLNNATFYIL